MCTALEQSRSAATVMAYLVSEAGKSLRDAYDLCKVSSACSALARPHAQLPGRSCVMVRCAVVRCSVQAARPIVSVNVGFVQQLAALEQRVRGSCSLDPHEYAVQDLWSMVKQGFVANSGGEEITEAHCRLAVQTHPVDDSGIIAAMGWLESADLDPAAAPEPESEEKTAEEGE